MSTKAEILSSRMTEMPSRGWKVQRLGQHLSAFEGKKILVIGDVGIDRYTEGKVERISPEAPVPIVHVTAETHKLGLAANVADNIRALGGEPFLVGLIGGDAGADIFRTLLQNFEISGDHLVVEEKRRTILKERVVSDRQQLLRIDYEDPTPISAKSQTKLLKKFSDVLDSADAVIIEDYAKGLLSVEFTQEVIRLARKKKKWIAGDPNPRSPRDLFRGVSMIKPNQKEAEALSGIKVTDPKSLIAVGRELLSRTKAEHLIITRGKDGVAVFDRARREVVSIPTFAREVFDVSGAGDTVIAVLALAHSVGASMTDAAILSNIAAGVEVGKRGTATVSVDEIRQALEFLVR